MDVFEMLTNLSDTAVDTAQVIVLAVAVIFLVYTAWRTRLQLIPLLSVAIIAGMLVWGVNNIDFFEKTIDDTITSVEGAQ